MGSVTNILEQTPHISGNAKCLTCGYKWVAIAPVGTIELECSECGTWKGVFNGLICPDNLIWECNCGNQHFYIDDTGAMCSRCGVRQSGFFDEE